MTGYFTILDQTILCNTYIILNVFISFKITCLHNLVYIILFTYSHLVFIVVSRRILLSLLFLACLFFIFVYLFIVLFSLTKHKFHFCRHGQNTPTNTVTIRLLYLIVAMVTCGGHFECVYNMALYGLVIFVTKKQKLNTVFCL